MPIDPPKIHDEIRNLDRCLFGISDAFCSFRSAGSTIKAIFRAYFGEGRNIGDLNVLADIAGETGLDRKAIVDFLNTDAGTAEVLKLEAQSKASGVRSVPSIQIAGDVISGAQPSEIMIQILKRNQAA